MWITSVNKAIIFSNEVVKYSGYVVIIPKGSISITTLTTKHIVQQEHFFLGNQAVIINNESNPIQILVINFNNNMQNIKGEVHHLTEDIQYWLTDLINMIDLDLEKMESMVAHLNEKLCEIIFKYSIKNTHNKLVGKIDERLLIVNRFIRKNYNKDITLSDLAKIVHSHPIHLCNTYSKVFKISPIRNMHIIRIKESKDYLKNSEMNNTEIAKKLGYRSASQFICFFKKVEGTTPFQFRKKYRENYVSHDLLFSKI